MPGALFAPACFLEFVEFWTKPCPELFANVVMRVNDLRNRILFDHSLDRRALEVLDRFCLEGFASLGIELRYFLVGEYAYFVAHGRLLLRIRQGKNRANLAGPSLSAVVALMLVLYWSAATGRLPRSAAPVVPPFVRAPCESPEAGDRPSASRESPACRCRLPPAHR